MSPSNAAPGGESKALPGVIPPCPRCGRPLSVRWQHFRHGSKHLRGSSPGYGHARFMPQSDTSAAALADPAPAERQGSLFDAA
jgi:hypothetical protein